MKTLSITAFLVLLGALSSAPAALFAEEPAATAPHQTLPLGEYLVYKIAWLGIPVGTGTLWVKEKILLDGREVFHVVGTVETNKVLRTIFPMRDVAHSWIDVETLESVKFAKKVNELRLKQDEQIVFDKEKKKGYFESFRTGEKKVIDIILPAHDCLSAFFWARRQELLPEQPIKIVLNADQKDWYMQINVLSREKVDWEGRRIDTYRVEPITRVEGEVKLGKAWVNVSADAERIPVRIVYKAPFGKVIGTLTKREYN